MLELKFLWDTKIQQIGRHKRTLPLAEFAKTMLESWFTHLWSSVMARMWRGSKWRAGKAPERNSVSMWNQPGSLWWLRGGQRLIWFTLHEDRSGFSWGDTRQIKDRRTWALWGWLRHSAREASGWPRLEPGGPEETRGGVLGIVGRWSQQDVLLDWKEGMLKRILRSFYPSSQTSCCVLDMERAGLGGRWGSQFWRSEVWHSSWTSRLWFCVDIWLWEARFPRVFLGWDLNSGVISKQMGLKIKNEIVQRMSMDGQRGSPSLEARGIHVSWVPPVYAVCWWHSTSGCSVSRGFEKLRIKSIS